MRSRKVKNYVTIERKSTIMTGEMGLLEKDKIITMENYNL
jgi:hypothetical protein